MGKSLLTKALYQAAIKYYNTRPGINFGETNVLMLAPTGKAAYNIKGNTIHSSLAIPACQSLKIYKSLDSGRLNTLRCQIGGVKLIFIDEISMVGNCMFNVQINNRLKDIKGSGLPFGAVSIIAIGDLFQLKPVMDGFIFNDMDTSNYGILAPNLWQETFKMFELDEIMRQRESKEFAEMLNRLREGKHKGRYRKGLSKESYKQTLLTTPWMLHICLYKMLKLMSSTSKHTMLYEVQSTLSKHMTV